MASLLKGELVQKAAGGATTSVDAADALAGADYVAIYFSAHWCPPCRGFTPRLSAWYKDNAEKCKVKLVFASSDRSEKDFLGYFNEMSWDLALPLNDRRVATLSGLFKVEGIPTLVVVDKDGKVVTTDAREGVIAEPDGFPWRSKTPRDLLAEAKGFTDKSSSSPVPFASSPLASAEYLALYFSAHWCPPCRGFTPELAAWYTSKKDAFASAGKSMDLIFVSSDKDEAAFNEYLSEMPWKALAFSDRATKEKLSRAFNVKGIPTLVVIDKEGNVVEGSARGKVSSEPDGFPWGPKPCSSLEDATEFINEAPTVVLFTDKLTDAAAEVTVNEAFRAVADSYWREGKPTTPLRFAIGADGDEAVDSVRSFLGTTRDKDGPTAVRVDIIDVRGQKKATLQAEGGKLLTGAEIKAFVAGYLDGSVAGTSIRDKK